LNPIHVIANPNARSGRGRNVLAPLERALGATGRPFRILRTEGPGHARTLALEVTTSGEPGPLLVVGGDGTLHEVANGLHDAGFPGDFPLALLPVGTGNDFHRMLRSGGGFDDTLRLLGEGEVRRFDLGVARWQGGEEVFVNLFGVGIDVAVLRRRDTFARLPGLLQYGAALFSALRGFRPPGVRVRFPDAPDLSGHDARALLAAVTVGPSIGGGFLLNPGALPEDGRLDFFLAEPLNALEVMRHLPGVVRGTLGTTDRIHRATFGRMRIEAPEGERLAFELDGELMIAEHPWIEIEVLPRALPILDRP
jgi:diacylglycerol kinase (ATP)